MAEEVQRKGCSTATGAGSASRLMGTKLTIFREIGVRRKKGEGTKRGFDGKKRNATVREIKGTLEKEKAG